MASSFSVVAWVALVTATLPIASGAPSNLDALVFLQAHAEKLVQPALHSGKGHVHGTKTTASLREEAAHSKGNSLPDVSPTGAHALQAVKKQVGALEAQLRTLRREGVAEVGQQKAAYEAKLKEQHKLIRLTKGENARIASEIASLQKSNGLLRAQSVKVLRSNHKLVASLEGLRANLTTAMEFVDNSVVASNELLGENASDLAVLREISRQESSEGDAKSHELQLLAVAAASEDVSLMQVEETKKRSVTALLDPREILQDMQSSLEELSKEQSASQAELEATFDAEFKAGAQQHSVLLQEQQTLNATRASEQALHARLTDAIEHLQAVQRNLMSKNQALRLFMQRLGSNTKHRATRKTQAGGASATSLLQVNGIPKLAAISTSKAGLKLRGKHDRSALVPMTVHEAAAKPREVFSAMSSTVMALEARLDQLKHEGVVALKKQKAEYERRLSEQAVATRAIRKANANLLAKVNALRQGIVHLRAKATRLTRDNTRLATELQRVSSNLSLALEFAHGALEADYQHAPEGEVLAEIAEKDAKYNAAKAHQRELDSISVGHHTIAMFQLGSEEPDTVQAGPENLLRTMISSLGDLKAQQNKSEAVLNASFDRLFEAGAQKQEELLREQSVLNATHLEQAELTERLVVAVKRLQDNHQFLQQRNMQVRLFAQRLGAPKRRKLKTSIARSGDKANATVLHNQLLKGKMPVVNGQNGRQFIVGHRVHDMHSSAAVPRARPNRSVMEAPRAAAIQQSVEGQQQNRSGSDHRERGLVAAADAEP